MTDAAGNRPVILVNPRLKVWRRLTLLICLPPSLSRFLCACVWVLSSYLRLLYHACPTFYSYKGILALYYGLVT
jgi:hypothetical protein